MPHTWESDLWSVQTDLVMALWLLLYGAAENTDSLSETLHEMFAGFYAAAGLWKFNSDFLDPKASCASVFFSQHVTGHRFGRILKFLLLLFNMEPELYIFLGLLKYRHLGYVLLQHAALGVPAWTRRVGVAFCAPGWRGSGAGHVVTQWYPLPFFWFWIPV